MSGNMNERSILLIGATGGVGKVLARSLMSRGYWVIATCRTKKQGQRLLSDGLCERTIQMNLGRTRSIESAFTVLEGEGIDALAGSINCAAITRAAMLETMSETDFREILQINVAGTLRAAQLSIPLLRHGQGRLIFVGSSGGDIALPALGGYSASKFALEALSDALRRELALWKIPVSLVKPGPIKTSMMLHHLKEIDGIITDNPRDEPEEYLKLYRGHRKRMEYGYRHGVAPEAVAATILKALEEKRPAARYTVGVQPSLANYASRLLPDEVQDRLLVLENFLAGE